MNILLVVNQKKDPEYAVAKYVIGKIGTRAQILMDETSRACGVESVQYLAGDALYQSTDLVLVLGGDGTILSVAKECASRNIPVIGINLGQLGFLVDIEKSEIDEGLEKLFAGEYITEERLMLQVDFSGAQKTEALNDIVVTRANSCLKILDLDIYIDDEYVDDFKADGIIVATPTGSTAYSLSAGGPIVDPSLDSLIITPICPHKMYSRTIMVPPDKTVVIKCKSALENEAIVAADSEILGTILKDDTVTIQIAPKKLKVIRLKGYQFFGALQKKLLKKER